MTRAALVLLALATFGACDTAFEPTLQGGPAAALFGTLDGRAGQQVLRVQILGTALLGTPDALPGTVTSTQFGTAATTAWRDSLVTLPGGERAHLFVADLAVAAGETHRIEAVRTADGATSTVTVRLPGPVATSGASMGGNVAVPVALTDLPGRVTEGTIRYRVRRTDGTGEIVLESPAAIQRGEGTSASFLAFLGPAQQRALDALYSTGTGELPVLLGATYEAVVFSIGGKAVENGVGEVGWVVPVAVPITFSREVLDAAGFVDGQ